MKRGNAKRKPAAPRSDIVAPTPEQMARGVVQEADVHEKRGTGMMKLGRAFQRVPMIDVLGRQGVFSDAELKALRHYRHHADIADRSPLRDSVGKLLRVGGGGTGPTIELLNAVRVRDDCERAAGSLVDILRAVVVYDQSLSQWAIGRLGSIEKCRDRKGKRICTVEATPKALAVARLDIQMAAKRVEAELAA